MILQEIQAKTILRKQKKIESWFLSRYGMNLYRGCSHNCVYCDGRAECYYVEGDFGQQVAVKIGAVEILQRELNPQRKRIPLKPSYIFLGGGVSDAYQPAEERYRITRRVLKLLLETGWPVHVLTKSLLVERDLDLILAIARQRRAMVSMSFSSADDSLSAIFEPGVAAPSQRLRMLARFKQAGIPIGMYLMPVIPYITDTAEKLEETLQSAVSAGIEFIIFGGLTLKMGRQRDYYLAVLEKHFPHLLPRYASLYGANPYGQAEGAYYHILHRRLAELCRSYKIPMRIPLEFWHDVVDENDRVIVLLEHMDYFLKLAGRPSSYDYAAHMLAQIREPLGRLPGSGQQIKGITPAIAQVVDEILRTGTSRLYEKLRRV